MTSTSAEPGTAAIVAGGAVQRFLRGFGYPFRGFRYLGLHPSLWRWVAVPAVINLLLFVGGVVGSWVAAPRLLSLTWARPEAGLGVVAWVVAVWLLRIALFAVVSVVIYVASGVLAAPFNEVISERVEQEQIGDASEPWGLRVFLRDTLVSVAHSLVSLSLYGVIMAVLLVCNLLPGLGGALFMVGSWVVSSFFATREMLDGVTSRRRMRLRAKFALLRQNLALTLGFGLATNLLLWVPLLNFLCMPVSVVGATLMYCDLERAGRAPPRRALPDTRPPSSPAPTGGSVSPR